MTEQSCSIGGYRTAAATKNALRVGDSKGGSQQRGEAEEANALASQADLDPDHIPFIIIDKTTNASETWRYLLPDLNITASCEKSQR